jgi:hypothetical protein
MASTTAAAVERACSRVELHAPTRLAIPSAAGLARTRPCSPEARLNSAALGAAVLAALALSGTPARAADAPAGHCPQPFKITLDVEWRGMSAGTSTLELTRENPTEYTYRSSNTARGLFKLAIPDTITQVSHIAIVDGKVRPSSYVGDDGSSSTEKDVALKFDWNAMRVTGVAEDKPVDAALAPGVQDSLSVQVALMCALAAGGSPKSFQLIDKTEVKEYQYTHEGDATLETPAGKLQTVIYTSQRKGAKRLTRLWIAPSLGYLPVRAEQVNKGKRELQLQLKSVERG